VKLILFDGYIHKVSFHTLSILQCGHPVSHGEHLVEIPILLCASQHASINCCDDIPDPCLQIINSCDLGSINSPLAWPPLDSL
jgi:hypothetical protein